MKTYEEYQYGAWRKCLKAAPLRHSGGLYGGGTENIVTEEMGVDCRNATESKINGTLQAKPNGGTSVNLNNVVRQQYAVRRLMPIECERLQGLPDNYTYLPGEKSCSDSARYKALGNGMAQPCADFVIRRIVEEVEKESRHE